MAEGDEDHVIEVHDIQTGYASICREVLARGVEVSPRGLKTREILAATIRVQDITRSMPLYIGRGVNQAIGAVEAVQLCGGFSDPDLTCRIAPNMNQFREVNGRFHGAYGPRLREQMQHLVRRLKSDKHSRQAVTHIWDWRQDLTQDKNDLPCTVSLHFMIRGGKLILQTQMRSHDCWWGLGYDVFQFSALQMTVATQLQIEAGEMYHHLSSLHLYERDWEKVDVLHPPSQIMDALYGFESFDRAWRIGHNLKPFDPSDTERWYWEQLSPYHV